MICLTETWCSDEAAETNSDLQIPNYKIFSKERSVKKRGGGIVNYIRNDLNTKLRNDLSNSDNDSEVLTIEVTNTASKNFLVSTCYRPPDGDTCSFSNYIKYLITKNKEQKKLFIIGDININILKYNEHAATKNFFDDMFQLNIFPIINKPTRVTSKSITAIDNILTNSIQDTSLKSGIIKTDISDHFPIYFSLSQNSTKIDNSKILFYKRIIDEMSTQKFKDLLSATNWQKVYQECNLGNTNSAYINFINLFILQYNESFPIQEKVIKAKYLNCPWITKEIRKSSKQKQKLYEKYLKNRSEANLSLYKQYKNLFEKIKKQQKKKYYSNQIKKFNGDSKKTWDVMMEIMGKSKSNSKKMPSRVIINEKESKNKRDISNKFNNYFANIGEDLASKIQCPNNSFKSYLTGSQCSFSFNELTQDELETAMKSIKIKSPGIDDISCKVVIDVFEEIRNPIYQIFNSSVTTGIVPDKLKISKIIPIYKSGETDSLNNYRPISILSVFSKLLERIIYNKLNKYLKTNQIINRGQYGFQKQHATEHAILDLSNRISKSFKQKKFTLGIFIDLSKAFDTVNHEILLTKMENYGIKNQALKWFKNYLNDRHQCVIIDKKSNSNLLKTKCGVPQGSILAPLLFLIYINDLPNASNIFKTIMFADDTNLFYSSKTIEDLFKKTNAELKKINIWFKSNKLSLNIEKTKYILFHSTQQFNKIPHNLPPINIENITIERARNTKFLGVLIDEHISWKPHISYINTRVSKNIGLLYKARSFLSQKSLKLVYFSFIHSYLMYANIAWGSTHKSKLEPLYLRQKHASRIVYNKNKLTHAQPLLEQMNALNIFQINIYQNILFMFKYKLSLVPEHFTDHFFEYNTNKYNTRAMGNFKIPFEKTKLSKFSLKHRGPYLFNNIIFKNESLINLNNEHSLKSKLKSTIIKFNNYKEFF
jgi:hypothetical protein